MDDYHDFIQGIGGIRIRASGRILISMPASRKRSVALAMLLLSIAVALTARAQSALDIPDPPSKAVVAIGVIALDSDAGSPAPSTPAERPASINGSGFFVSKQGHVITAEHVVRAAERAREQMQGANNKLFVGLRANGSFVPVPAEVIALDEAHDLALLRAKVPTASINVVKVCSTRPADGTLIEAAGLPALTGMAPVYNTGHLADTVLLRAAVGSVIVKPSAKVDAARLKDVREFYLADSKADEGMSGGPVYLVDSGAVIGVVQGYTQDPRLAVLVPARYVIELLKSYGVAFEEFSPDKSD
jgi:S1-C subfamily serine protease